MSEMLLTLEHGIKAYVQLGQMCDDAENVKEAFSRILEINYSIYDLQSKHSLLDNEVIYLRDIIDKEAHDMALKIRSSVLDRRNYLMGR